MSDREDIGVENQAAQASLEDKILMRDMIRIFKYLKGGHEKDGQTLLFPYYKRHDAVIGFDCRFT